MRDWSTVCTEVGEGGDLHPADHLFVIRPIDGVVDLHVVHGEVAVDAANTGVMLLVHPTASMPEKNVSGVLLIVNFHVTMAG